MKAIYTDLHIHTSQDADKLNEEYDVNTLIKKVKEFSKTDNILLSLTDHNTINKTAYKNLLETNLVNVILGVELHIRNYDKCPPYHCHVYFNIDQDEILKEIDNINQILNTLYPVKTVSENDIIPKIEDIAKSFDKYDYVMLPHGGQSHKTFDKSIPKGKRFDTVMERNIYYNQFDGFTSRSNHKLEDTIEYFKKLGINSFINLITCTDNYSPKKYPNSKSSDYNFVPTWIKSKPTFSGLRLALSETTRLFYQVEEPQFTNDYIKHVELKNDLISIDVDLTPGLNVVIGGSSSGKTLFLDSVFSSINNSFTEDNPYKKYSVHEINVDNPAGSVPHYINQNYIIKLIDDKSDDGIENIDIIKNTFLANDELDQIAQKELSKLKETLLKLFSAAENIEMLQKQIRNIPHFPRLMLRERLEKNYFEQWLPSHDIQGTITIKETDYSDIKSTLELIKTISKSNPFMKDLTVEVDTIMQEFEMARIKKELSDDVESVIKRYKLSFDKTQSQSKSDETRKKQQYDNLLEFLKDYKINTESFYDALKILKGFKFKYNTKPVISKGHTLTIESSFELNKDIILESLNNVLLSACQIKNYEEIFPESLFRDRIKKNIKNYKDNVFGSIEKKNKKEYCITTRDGKDFKELSPGWKTAVLLDLVLGYDGDSAPIFIDQPEDNLATDYINNSLVKAVKESKDRRQIIVISHNATIPMLADAQNIILCKNENGHIKIQSGAMEDSIDGVPVIDSIANITDGGKASVKKRVKKYNLRSYRE